MIDTKIQRWKKRTIFAISLTLIITGCSTRTKMSSDTAATDNEVYFAENEESGTKMEESDPVILQLSKACHDIFEYASATNSTGSLETAKSLAVRIGENGYTAVDRQNQINMVNAEQAVQFCKQAEAGEQAELTIIVVEDTGGLTKYDFRSEADNLDIVKSYYKYEDGELKSRSTYSYPADFWQYTEEGYFLFSGSYYSQDYYIYAVSDVSACTALRVQPLEEKCREWNRQYILPVGYSKNDLFLSDWNEPDFRELNFYDIFDKLYPMVNGTPVPYTADENLGVGAVYRISEEEFEHVIMSHFQISQETLRSKTTFFPEDSTYEYKPRGLHESESGDAPYPEVVGYEENDDGTITLTVNAVYPRKNTTKAFSHEVVIRALADGGFQYVSNQIIQSPDNYEPTWRRERLTEERWEEIYGKN